MVCGSRNKARHVRDGGLEVVNRFFDVVVKTIDLFQDVGVALFELIEQTTGDNFGFVMKVHLERWVSGEEGVLASIP